MEINERDKSAEDFAFDEMAALVAAKAEAGIEFQVFVKQLEEKAAEANRRVEVARSIADICKATKTRKPRKDKGVPRKKPDAKPLSENKNAENCSNIADAG